MPNYYLNQDDNEDDLTQDDPTEPDTADDTDTLDQLSNLGVIEGNPNPVPAKPATSLDPTSAMGPATKNPDIENKEAYVKSLRDRLMRGEDANAQDAASHGLSSALMKSASQIGSFHGHTADTSAVDQFKKDLDSANAARLAKQQNELTFANKDLSDAEARQQKADYVKQMLQQKEADRRMKQGNFDAQSKNYNARTNAIANANKLKANDKIGADQDKAYTELTQKIQSFRGNQAVARAAQNELSAKNALAMVQGKDPDTLTKQQIALFSDELAKIATGGVPGEHGVQMLMPNTLQTKIAEMQSFLSGEPSSAEAGEYIANNIEYLKDLANISHGSVNNYKMGILKGYKRRVRPEDYQSVMDQEGLNEAPQTATNATPSQTKTDGSTAMGAAAGKTEVKRQYSPSKNQTRVTYSDGSTQILDGKQQ